MTLLMSNLVVLWIFVADGSKLKVEMLSFACLRLLSGFTHTSLTMVRLFPPCDGSWIRLPWAISKIFDSCRVFLGRFLSFSLRFISTVIAMIASSFSFVSMVVAVTVSVLS